MHYKNLISLLQHPPSREPKSAFYQPLLSVTLQSISKGLQSLHLFPSYVQNCDNPTNRNPTLSPSPPWGEATARN
uniref:Uncharacterized protein n=1 Tax=Anguilla anguilla TaxID=7936 RepID=A0A0E9V5Q4_ANGAN